MRPFMIAAAAMLFIAPLTPASAAGVSKSEISDILSEQGYNVQDFNSNTLRVSVSDYTILIAVVGADSDIIYRTYVPNVSARDVSLSFLNKFNNKVKFGRVYVDGDGDVAIQMDRNSSGGVSTKNIESDFDVFLSLISMFLSELESQAVA